MIPLPRRYVAPPAARHAPPERRSSLRWVELALLVVGLVGLAAIVREIGFDAVLDSFRRLRTLLPLLLLFPGVLLQVSETLAWRFAFRHDVAPFRELFVARLAGEALSATTPTATVGGESVKAWLLSGRARVREIVPSLVVAKTSDAVAQFLFLALGLALAWQVPHLDQRMLHGMVTLLLIEAVCIVGFAAVQTSGALARVRTLLGRLRVMNETTADSATLHVDRALARYYRLRGGRFFLSTTCNLTSCLLSAVETAILTHALGGPGSFANALVVNAIASGISFIAFFVPGQIAVREGAFVAAFVALGLDPAVGLSVALAKRVLDLTWAGIGLVVLARRRRATRVTDPRPLSAGTS
ncbi:MAG: lysylphosphatidylglycerol synthase domain-containing protein [Thermodesulfobacteriota bacterium]